MQSLEVSYHLPISTTPKSANRPPLYLACLPYILLFYPRFGFQLHSDLTISNIKRSNWFRQHCTTMPFILCICICFMLEFTWPRWKNDDLQKSRYEIRKPRITNHQDIIPFITMTFYVAAPLHPIPSPWKFQHPFHGRLTSNMSCKHCDQQVSLCQAHDQKFGSCSWIFIRLLCLFVESSAVWLIWVSLSVHPITSVGKWKCHSQHQPTVDVALFFYFDLHLFSGETNLVRSVSTAFHLLRNHQRSGVWKLHQGTFAAELVSYNILLIA